MTSDVDLSALHLALLHWPIIDKIGDMIATACTNLDVHDIGRLAATYGLGGYWMVQPLESQRAMVQRILHHWTEGPGAQLHPDRPTALANVHAVADLNGVDPGSENVFWVATTAKPTRPSISVTALAEQMADAKPTQRTVLMLGTGWGLAPQVLQAADAVLEPIRVTDYYHLSVRSAAAIYLDRIWRALTTLHGGGQSR